ncbi:hypothetical protein F511_19955 [Dorcoceras hygrometricum]|uniref:Uncharacterized protein n=1 Tax=Dorcoceras hygrometricum TaxID=472368 RepID=A0A2Z7AF80_9LAMI|nr:hypothetical protein F511_19955 [Dorcoceras hygrometricum]
MGCPGQARTKPRRQNSRRNAAEESPEGGCMAAAATCATCGAWPHDAVARQRASPRDAWRKPRATVRYTSARWPASARDSALASARWSSISRPMMGLNQSNGLGSGPGPYEHSVRFHHRGSITTPIDDQIAAINTVSKTEYYDVKQFFRPPVDF